MKSGILAAAGAAAVAVTMSATTTYAGYADPGETMGVSLLSPLPEGVFFADLENYGRADAPGSTNVGVNIPVILWSTPYSFYNTRLEFIVALPFAHVDGPVVNTTGLITWAAGPLFAHDFGNGLTGGAGILFRSPSPSPAFRENVDGRTVFALDIRESLQYKFAGPGFFNGVTIMENAFYTPAIGSNYGPTTSTGTPVQNDFFAGDFTIEKTYGNFTFGFTGFGNIDTDNRNLGGKVSAVELGGLIGYDFGTFNLTGIVTRTVLTETAGINNGAYETRGWVRLIVPLYVAPTAPVIAARY